LPNRAPGCTSTHGGLVQAEDGADGDTDVGAAADGVIAITPISGAGDAVRQVNLDGLVSRLSR
jgi:hypothetical protein